MALRPRTWWLLGGCGCALVALLVGVVAGLWHLWPRPAPPRRPPVEKRSEIPGSNPPFYSQENERVPAVGRTVCSGPLDSGRDVTIPCDSTLTVTVPAGTFPRPETVTVKLASVESRVPATIARPLAIYEVAIGVGGPLTRPVTLTFTHPALGDGDRLAAARWDPETRNWVPAALTRRSATTSVVETDHLSIFSLEYWDLHGWDRWRSEDGSVTVYVRENVVPNLDPLYSAAEDPRPKDSDTSPRAKAERSKAHRSRRERFDREVSDDSDYGLRRHLALVVAEMAARVRARYARSRFPASARLHIYVDKEYGDPTYVPALTGAYIGLGPSGHDGPETLAFNIAHEIFHDCQNNTGLEPTWLKRVSWLTEATAEYAAGRVAWADLSDMAFTARGVVVDDRLLRAKMGDDLEDTYIEGLVHTRGDHPYFGAHFLEYLFARAPQPGTLGFLWERTLVNGILKADEGRILDELLRQVGLPADEAVSDFVAFLLLDQNSPVAARPAMAKVTNHLGPAAPSWSGRLPLEAPYSGAYERFELAAAPGRSGAQSLALTFQGSGAPARVVAYREAASGSLNLGLSAPVDRVTVHAEPKVLTVSMKGGEKLCVIASRGKDADPQLTLRAELTTSAVTATRLQGSRGRFRLEVQGSPLAAGRGTYRWNTGDPAAPGPIETRTNTLDHAYSRPGEHEVRVTFLEGENREPAGEAVGQVTVPSALQVTVFDGKTGRPLGGANVRLQYEGRTHTWGTDPSGAWTIENVPPRGVSFSIEVSAEGFETFAKTSEFDMSEGLVVPKKVTLTPRPPLSPTTTTRPPAPPSEPPPPPAAEPEPPPVAPVPTTPPAETRHYDEAAALAAYVADFEAQYRGVDRVEGATVEYRLEWVTRPFIRNGQVMGDYRLFRIRRRNDGTVDPPFEEHAAYGTPVPMTTVVKLQDKYPQFRRR